jgi:hypothetical protein
MTVQLPRRMCKASSMNCDSAHLLQEGDCLLWAADVLRHCDRHLGQAELVQAVRKPRDEVPAAPNSVATVTPLLRLVGCTTAAASYMETTRTPAQQL